MQPRYNKQEETTTYGSTHKLLYKFPHPLNVCLVFKYFNFNYLRHIYTKSKGRINWLNISKEITYGFVLNPSIINYIILAYIKYLPSSH